MRVVIALFQTLLWSRPDHWCGLLRSSVRSTVGLVLAVAGFPESKADESARDPRRSRPRQVCIRKP